ncbi:MAG: protein kinase [Gemmatimonadetes bacterium]|nr:protein kinase [Gemmatimonadota bacterium]
MSATPAPNPASLPAHLVDWKLPSQWGWGHEGVWLDRWRHSQEVVDALGRSLSLVTAPDPAHAEWLTAEARALAHRNAVSAPTAYHFWARSRNVVRGPGYLRRWIAGEALAPRLARDGALQPVLALDVLRQLGSTVASLHDRGDCHGAIGPELLWQAPGGRVWLLGWHWALPRAVIPAGLAPERGSIPWAPEWATGWQPDALSDQWQLACTLVAALTGLPAGTVGAETAAHLPLGPGAQAVFAQALSPVREARFPTLPAFLRALERADQAPAAVPVRAVEPGIVPTTAEGLQALVGADYQVLAPLGEGGAGTVWRVRDVALERDVALKLLHAERARDPRAIARFRHEASMAARLQHPAIIPVHDWDTRSGIVWYTMELAESGSLATLVARHGARPIEEVGSQFAQLLEGLQAAHRAGVLHLDLKPENVLIDRWRYWRLSDFGIAGVHGGRAHAGTPGFAPPEQVEGRPVDERTDLYGAAALAAYALTGWAPFGGGTVEHVLRRQREAAPSLPDVAPPVARVLTRALAPDAEARFADAGEFLRAWRAALVTAPEPTWVDRLRGIVSAD